MLSFLAQIFQGIVTSAIFESGMAGISSLRKDIKEHLRKQFADTLQSPNMQIGLLEEIIL